jgi:hypothetical protein
MQLLISFGREAFILRDRKRDRREQTKFCSQFGRSGRLALTFEAAISEEYALALL